MKAPAKKTERQINTLPRGPIACDHCNKPIGYEDSYSRVARDYTFGSIPWVSCGDCCDRKHAGEELDVRAAMLNRAARHSIEWRDMVDRMLRSADR